MTSVGLLNPSSGYEASTSGTIDRLPEAMNGMSIRDDKVNSWWRDYLIFAYRKPLIVMASMGSMER
jgi:hypothetical protein